MFCAIIKHKINLSWRCNLKGTAWFRGFDSFQFEVSFSQLDELNKITKCIGFK